MQKMVQKQKIVVKIIDNLNSFKVKIDLDKTIRQLKHKLAYINQNFDEIDKIQLFYRNQMVQDHQILNQYPLDNFDELELKISNKSNQKILQMESEGSMQNLQKSPRYDNINQFQNQQQNQIDAPQTKKVHKVVKIRQIRQDNPNKDNYNYNQNYNNLNFRNQIQIQSLSMMPSQNRKKNIIIKNISSNKSQTIVPKLNKNIDINSTNFDQVNPNCTYCNLQIPDQFYSLPCLCRYHEACFDKSVTSQLDQQQLELVCSNCTKPISNQLLSQNQQDRLYKMQLQIRNLRFKKQY